MNKQVLEHATIILGLNADITETVATGETIYTEHRMDLIQSITKEINTPVKMRAMTLATINGRYPENE